MARVAGGSTPGEGPGEGPGEPRGVVRFRWSYQLVTGGLLLAGGLLAVTLPLWYPAGAGAAPFWVGFPGGVPLLLGGVSHFGRLRGGGVRMELTERGIELRKLGLWTLLPWVEIPAPEVIPWQTIRDIVPVGEKAVLIDCEGRWMSAWERFLWKRYTGGRDRGRVIGLAGLDVDRTELRDMLLAWNDQRLLADVRGDRLSSGRGPRQEPK